MIKQKQYAIGSIETPSQNNSSDSARYRHKKGAIRDNAIQALLHDPLFRQRIERKRKGKGSYQRQEKYRLRYDEKSDYQLFTHRNLIIGFFGKQRNSPQDQ